MYVIIYRMKVLAKQWVDPKQLHLSLNQIIRCFLLWSFTLQWQCWPLVWPAVEWGWISWKFSPKSAPVSLEKYLLGPGILTMSACVLPKRTTTLGTGTKTPSLNLINASSPTLKCHCWSNQTDPTFSCSLRSVIFHRISVNEAECKFCQQKQYRGLHP